MNGRITIFSRQSLRRLAIFLGLVVAALAFASWWMLYAPGHSYAGEVHVGKTQLSDELEKHVRSLVAIGDRGVYKPQAYGRAADYIHEQFRSAGYQPRLQSYQVQNVTSSNIEVELPGGRNKDQIIIIGAHYDTVQDSPGANDNSSGVAGVLALSRMLKDAKPSATIRFVAFANEEPPYFQTDLMGSMVYAKACKDRGEKIVAMWSLETIGYYSDKPNSQRYPPPFDKLYPSTGNFIGFVGNVTSRSLVQKSIGSFRKHCEFPSESGAIPESVTGIGWSDQWSFWQCGYEALMVTDTAPFRYAHYHSRSDTPEKLDFPRMAKVVEGLKAVLLDLAAD